MIAGVIGETPIVSLLGAIITLTGLVHVFEGFRVGEDRHRQRSWTSAVLGIFEIALGGVVLLWRDEFGRFFYAVVMI